MPARHLSLGIATEIECNGNVAKRRDAILATGGDDVRQVAGAALSLGLADLRAHATALALPGHSRGFGGA